MKYLLETVTVILAFTVGACGDKKEEILQSEPVSENRVAEQSAETIVIINDTVKRPAENKLRVTASVYDAAALPLGENFKSTEQLKKARKIAELTNITLSGQLAKIDDQCCVFATEALLGEDFKLVDVAAEIAVRDMSMKFSTTLRRGSSAFYEMNQSEDTSRMYVVVLNVEFENNESK